MDTQRAVRDSPGSGRAAELEWRSDSVLATMDKTAVVKVGAAASASLCALFGGVALAQYIVAKKKRAGKKTRIIEMVSLSRNSGCVKITRDRYETGNGEAAPSK